MKNALLFLLFCLLPFEVFGQQDSGQTALVFTHVTVIDATGAPAKIDMTVVVRGDRIEELGKTGMLTVPQKAQVVDATGKFLIPGLWDMHIHPHHKKEYLSLFITNGITGMRVMWGAPEHHKWRKEIMAGELIGPRMIISGNPPIGHEDEGRQAVRKIKEEGADLVKIGNLNMPRDTYFAIADEAKKLGIPFAGHLPFFVSLAEASDAGLQSIEHTVFVVFACSSEEEGEIRKKAKKMRETLMGEEEKVYARNKFAADVPYSEKKAAEIFARLVKNSTWVCPTLIVRKRGDVIVGDSRLKYLPLSVRDLERESVRLHTTNRGIWDNQRKFFEKNSAIVDAMNDAGVGLLAGTDTYMPGLDLQDELVLLVQAGLSPMEALQTATYNAAKCLDLLDSMGTIERGKVADLVLLDSNPLHDIGNTRKIAAVVVGGKIFDKPMLQKMLAEVEGLEYFHEVAANGEIEQVKLLILEGADVNVRCADGRTPLFYAAERGHKEVVEVLLAHGADINAKKTWGGMTSLHLAVKEGQKDMVEYLIAKGANVKETDNYNRTPLDFAKREGHTEIVELLHKHGAKE